jgi:hypothetical protein
VNGAIVIAAKSERDGFQSVFSIARNGNGTKKKTQRRGKGGWNEPERDEAAKEMRRCMAKTDVAATMLLRSQ